MSDRETLLLNAMDVYGDMVYRLALCQIRNEADAEDIFQDVFLCLLKEKDAEHWNTEHLKAWLLRVAINRCHNLVRTRKRRQTISFTEIPETASETTAGDSELWEALGNLPEKFRTVILLHYAEGYKTEEIAKLLKCSAATIRSRLYRGRRRLWKMMGGILNEEPLQRYDGKDQSPGYLEK